jgi:hypothetical protein
MYVIILTGEDDNSQDRFPTIQRGRVGTHGGVLGGREGELGEKGEKGGELVGREGMLGHRRGGL